MKRNWIAVRAMTIAIRITDCADDPPRSRFITPSPFISAVSEDEDIEGPKVHSTFCIPVSITLRSGAPMLLSLFMSASLHVSGLPSAPKRHLLPSMPYVESGGVNHDAEIGIEPFIYNHSLFYLYIFNC